MKLINRKTGQIVVFSEGIVDLNDIGCKNVGDMIEQGWEDYEEPKEYWYINDLDGEPMKCDLRNCGKQNFSRWGEHRKQIGNYFETIEEAEKAVEKLKAWKRLKDAGFIFRGWDWTPRNGEINLTIKATRRDWYEEQLDDLKLLFGGEEQ